MFFVTYCIGLYVHRSTIGALRNQLDNEVKQVTKLKIEKNDIQTRAEIAKSSVDTLADQLKTVEARCQTYKVLNTELTHKLEGTVAHVTHSMEQQHGVVTTSRSNISRRTK